MRHERNAVTLEAAQRFIEAALKADDSLFTPGKQIWTVPLVDELHRLFIENPDESSDTFLEKFRRQLDSASESAKQLAAELLWVHFLTPKGTSGEKKREIINEVLSWMDGPPELPSSLADALDHGFVGRGFAFTTQRPFQLAYLIEFVRRWKQLTADERDAALMDPWRFRDVAWEVPINRGQSQREALLYLVHPDTFEDTISRDALTKIATYFSELVDDESANTHHRVFQVRERLAERYGSSFSFFDPELRPLWEADSSKWDQLVQWMRLFFEDERFDEDEREYKLELGRAARVVRTELAAGSGTWLDSLEGLLRHKQNNIVPWMASSTFLGWATEHPTETATGLGALWRQSGELKERIDDFVAALPAEAFKGGVHSRLTLASYLLMANSPEDNPPYRYEAFKRLVALAGHASPPKSGTEGAVYAYALDFLDTMIDQADNRGLTLRDRLDAQGLVWCIHSTKEKPESWPDQDWESFLTYREGIEPSDPDTGSTVVIPDDEPAGRFWWVNQGDSFSAESQGGYVWAPHHDSLGRQLTHHKNVSKLRAGDVILHYATGAIRAIGTVVSPPTSQENLAQPGRGVGHHARVRYELLSAPIELAAIPEDLRSSGEEPFTRSGGVKQGYLYPVSESWVKQLKRELGDALPVNVEAADPEQRFWLFQANVTRYHLQSELQQLGQGGLETWMVTRHRDEMRVGDPVALWQSGKQAGVYGIAEITGEPFETEMPDWSHDTSKTKVGWQVPLRVLSVPEDPILKGEILGNANLADLGVIRSPQGTNFKVTPQQWKALQALLAGRVPEVQEELPLAEVSRLTSIDADELRHWVHAIHRKGQGILYGPPGTGKTFVAKLLARHLVGGSDGFVDLVQFHPAYAYEDFIQGLRPHAREDGALDYQLVAGRFLDFCRRAQGREGTCVLVIDEINRANLARVFGELMYLLEYRDADVPLASGERFEVPKNVRLIGTMNTADRSIALVDHALRRRFAFIALYPKYDVLLGADLGDGVNADGLVSLLEQINGAIGDRNYEIGISFFLHEDLGLHLEDIWRMEIEPYLEEYFFDQPKKVDQFRWGKIREQVL